MVHIKDKTAWCLMVLGLLGFSAPAQGLLVSDSPGAFGVWHMDTASGNAVPDDNSANLGRSNALHLWDGMTLGAGLDGNALVCDGVSGYATSSYLCLPTDTIHVETYIKCNTVATPEEGYHILNASGDDANSLFQVVQYMQKIYFYGSASKVKSHGVLNTTDWWKVEGDIVAAGLIGTATITLTNMTTMETYTNSADVGTVWTTPKYVMAGAIDVGTGPLYPFNGMIDGTKIDIPTAYHAGDANGDGQVGLSDLQILGDNWQSTDARWAQADFTGERAVDLADLQILGDNWGYGTTPDMTFEQALASVMIPEPTSLTLLSLGVVALWRRRTDR